MEEERVEKPSMDEERAEKPSQPLFLEVSCSSSGKFRRFAAGTEAGFALYLINKKLEIGVPQAFLIEAYKEGEEPVSFGPNAVLVNYGEDWKLQTVTGKGFEEAKHMHRVPGRFHTVTNSSDAHSPDRHANKSNSSISLWYIGKISLAFAFICLLGGILALFLEYLPMLISIVNSSL